MRRTVKPSAFFLTLVLLACGHAAHDLLAQAEWTVPRRDREILVDGFLREWQGVPALELSPSLAGISREGEFKEGDLRVAVQALWDEQYLYVALTWQDDTWDVEEVTRRDAVWVDAQRKRRDRMLLFDYLKFHVRQSDYDYTFWVSPFHQEKGPFFWHRLLEGYRGMERAAGTPMITARELDDGRVTIELMFFWKELRLRPKDGFPLTLIVADSDLPGRLPEYKLGFLKWIQWRGGWRFAQ
jgi:hypothetical protein